MVFVLTFKRELLASILIALLIGCSVVYNIYLSTLILFFILILFLAINYKKSLFLLVFILPFEKMFFPVLIDMRPIKWFLIILILLVFLLIQIKERRKLLSTPYDSWILLFILVLFLTSFTGIFPIMSLYYSSQYIFIFIFFWLIVQIFSSVDYLHKLVNIIFISAAVVLIYGLIDYKYSLTTSYVQTSFLYNIFFKFYFADSTLFTHVNDFRTPVGVRTTSLFTNPNIFGAYLSGTIIFINAFIFYKNYNFKKYLLLLYIVSIFLLILTFSKGAILSTFVGLFFFFLIKRDTGNKSFIVILFILIILIIFVFFVLPISLFSFDDILNSLGIKYNDILQTGYRLKLWSISFNIIKDNLLFGVGSNALKFVLPFYDLIGIYYKNISHSHNLFLNMIVEYGIMGFILYVWFIINFFYTSFKMYYECNDSFYKTIILSILCIGISRIVHEFFDSGFSIGVNSAAFVFWLLLAINSIIYNLIAKEKGI